MNEIGLALRTLGAALHKEAQARRDRAIAADQQKGGAVADEVVARWASSFATAYQTLRGVAIACEQAAEALEKQSA